MRIPSGSQSKPDSGSASVHTDSLGTWDHTYICCNIAGDTCNHQGIPMAVSVWKPDCQTPPILRVKELICQGKLTPEDNVAYY